MDQDRIRILVLDRGFVMVGRCPDPKSHGFWLTVTDARIIRRWGTSNGLGELVNGPTAETVLDVVVPEESIPVRAVVRILEVRQEQWEQHLKT